MTSKARAILNSDADANLANNDTRDLSEADIRTSVKDLADSAVLLKDSDTLENGYLSTVHDLGTVSSGTTTLAPANSNFQKMTNNGASTLAAPTATGAYAITILITNAASAGAITLSGFSNTSGDDFTTTNGDDFFVDIRKIDSFTSAHVEALQ